MRSQAEEFSAYFEKWVRQLEEYSQQLLGASRSDSSSIASDQEIRDLVSKMTTHHKEYYTEKWATAREDVFTFFSPSWWSPLENAYSWLTGWKPSKAFRLIETLRRSGAGRLAQMSEEQTKKLEQLKVKIRFEEDKVESEMERQQVALADKRIVELARLANHRGGDAAAAAAPAGSKVSGTVEVAIRSLAGGLERIMKGADCVRLKTLKGILDLLSPLQSVEFLAAFSVVQIQLRRWGREDRASLREIK